MALVDVTKACLDSISQISEHIEGAILYLDAGCAESFQFTGAFPVLLDLGVRAVCSLENMTDLDSVVDWNSTTDPARNLVVFTSCLLSDAHRYILRCLSTHQGLHHCTIFTSISEIAHSAYPDSPLGPDAFHEYESLLVQDYDELVKKCKTKSGQSEDSKTHERDSYEESLISRSEDVGPNLIVSVHHFPMILCPFSPRVFVLPSEGSVAEARLSTENDDFLCPGLPPLSTGLPPDGDDVPPGATLTAHFLYHLASKMDLKMEIFSLGDLSKSVGNILTGMSSLYDVGRRKRSAGLLLIDRTLDLLTPCSHGDSLVDRIFSSLPRKEKTTSYVHTKSSQTLISDGPDNMQRAPIDVQIPLVKLLCEEDSKTNTFQLLERVEAFLSGWDSGSYNAQNVEPSSVSSKLDNEKHLHSNTELLCGSFVSTESFHGTPYLEAILERKTKDGAILIRKWLQETLRKENVTVNVKTRPGYVTKLELQSMIKTLAKSQASFMRNKGIIQLAAAAAIALDESHSVRWDAFMSAETILSVNAGDTSQNLAAQIADLINKSSLVASNGQKQGKIEPSQGVLSFQDALLLMITGYILAGENFPTSGSDGPFSWQEERLLKDEILDAIMENPAAAKLKFLHGLMEELEANQERRKSGKTESASSLNKSQADDFDDDQWGNWGDEDGDSTSNKEDAYDDVQLKLELRDRVDNLFRSLYKLSGTKKRDLPWRDSLSMVNFSGDNYGSKGLLHKVLAKVLSKHDVPGLEYHSSTMGRLFKTGFGRFGLGQAKPSLADQNVILVFVLGGINGLEVHEAFEALSESGRPDIELIIGGTTLLSPDDMLDLLLGNCG